jgi:hypothetical protein
MIHSGQVVRDIMPSRDVAAAFNVRQASKYSMFSVPVAKIIEPSKDLDNTQNVGEE